MRREKLARAVAEGALEAARRDYAKAMREVMALQRTRRRQPSRPGRAPPTPPKEFSAGLPLAAIFLRASRLNQIAARLIYRKAGRRRFR